MSEVNISGIINTSIVSAFTIAAAFIWKDVIVETIELLFPAEILLLKFIAAILSTVLVVIAIYIILHANTKTEVVLRKIKNVRNGRKKEAK